MYFSTASQQRFLRHRQYDNHVCFSEVTPHVDAVTKCHCCQQSVNILSIADNDGTICHQLFLGTDIALMVSEVRPSDEGNERNLRTMDEPRINKELIDN